MCFFLLFLLTNLCLYYFLDSKRHWVQQRGQGKGMVAGARDVDESRAPGMFSSFHTLQLIFIYK